MAVNNLKSLSQDAKSASTRTLVRKIDTALAITGGVLLVIGFVAAFGLPWIRTVLEVAK